MSHADPAAQAGPSPFDVPKPASVADEQKDGPQLEELPLMKSPMVTRAPFIIVQEACERLAYYGIATNIVVYLTHVLNLSNSTATAAIQIWSGTCYVTPILGAFISDSYWGRFWTILVFSIAYMIGMVGLALDAGLPGLRPEGDSKASSGQLAFFWTAMYLVALGTGGIKPCVSSFGADQFNEDDPRERALIPRFFNWFYASINVGAILATTVIVNLQTNVSWALGFAIPAGAFGLAIIIFLIGAPLYRRVPPAGSPFTRMFRVLGGAFTHRKAEVPEDDSKLHEVEGEMSIVPGQAKIARTPTFKWLEKAAVPVQKEGAKGGDAATEDKWLVTLTEVEELKCVIRLLPIFFTLIIYNAVYAQMATLFVLQGEAMNTSLGSINVAAATVSVLDPISVIIWVFLYDVVIDPFFAKRGRPISTLKRIGIGYVAAILTMVAAAVVEIIRLQVVSDNNLQDTDPTVITVPMAVWWQIPQYFLLGMSEAFAMVGSLELFYSQAPDAMRSTCSALQLVATACGNYLAAALVGIVQSISNGGWITDNLNQAHIDYFFFMLAVLQFLGLVAFLIFARRFRYRAVKHTTIDAEALALAPEGRGAANFSIRITRSMSRDLGSGMVSIESYTRASFARRRASQAVSAHHSADKLGA